MPTSSAASRIQANLQDLFKANLSPGDSYIRFQLTSNMTALLSMKQVQESLVVDVSKITTLPSMPESVIGIMNSRNHVFCVFDLAQLLGLPSSLGSPRQYQVIVLQTTNEQPIYLGLAVSHIQGMSRISADKIQSSTAAFSISSYLYGVVQQQELAIPILNLPSILETISTQK